MLYFVTDYRFLENGYRNSDDYKDPRVSALLNTSFEGLPPCLLIVADLDPLRDGNLGMRNYKSLSFIKILIFNFRISKIA
jgi:acetyl esterase/lipase